LPADPTNENNCGWTHNRGGGAITIFDGIHVKQMSLLGAEKIERGDYAGNQSTA
jgi:hypothetical protein